MNSRQVGLEQIAEPTLSAGFVDGYSHLVLELNEAPTLKDGC